MKVGLNKREGVSITVECDYDFGEINNLSKEVESECKLSILQRFSSHAILILIAQ